MAPNDRLRLQVEQLEERCVPATFTVTKLDDSLIPVPGLNLREAIAKANSTATADTIVFKDTLKGTIALNLSELDITTSLTINGLGASRITIDAQDASRIFNVDDGLAGFINVTIRKLSLTRGLDASLVGGGAIFSGENLTVANARLFDNRATNNGGAIFQSAGTLTVSSCSFFDNIAVLGEGGAINLNQVGDTAVISNSTFFQNQAQNGGAIENRGTMTIHSSTLSGNSAFITGGVGGGAIHAQNGGSLTLIASTVSGNAAKEGGALNIGPHTVQIIRSTIAYNTSDQRGGGIFINSATADVTIQNSTISSNWAGTNGGGIALVTGGLTVQNSTVAFNQALTSGGGIFADADATLVSTIIARNRAAASGQDLFSVANPGDDYLLTNCLIEADDGAFSLDGASANNQGDVDPRLGPLASNGGPTQTHALLTGSPAINNGSNPLGLTTDQRGSPFKRVKGGAPDIGAFEL